MNCESGKLIGIINAHMNVRNRSTSELDRRVQRLEVVDNIDINKYCWNDSWIHTIGSVWIMEYEF